MTAELPLPPDGPCPQAEHGRPDPPSRDGPGPSTTHRGGGALCHIDSYQKESGGLQGLIDHRSAPHSFDHFVVAREQRRRCFEVEYPQLVVCVLFRVSSTIGNRSVRFCTTFP
jgi:hypothetical protein